MTNNEFIIKYYKDICSVAGKVWGRHSKRFPVPLTYDDYQQNVFVKLLVRKNPYDPARSRLTTYLGMVSYSVLIDEVRKSTKYWKAVVDISNEAWDEIDPHPVTAEPGWERVPAHLHSTLYKLLNNLPLDDTDDQEDCLDWLMNE